MAPKFARRFLLLCLVLASCAQETVIGGYQWVADSKAPKCDQVIWKQVKPEELPGLCMGTDGKAASEYTSCTIGCLVLSRYTAAQAIQIKLGWDDDLYTHESRHALLGWVHPGR